MLNKLIIDVNTSCRCDCAESVDNGENTITIEYKKSSFATPKIELVITNYQDESETSYEHDLTVSGQTATYLVPEEYYLMFGKIKFRFVDIGYEGTWFDLICVNFAGDYGESQTLYMYKSSDFVYVLSVLLTDSIKKIDTNSFDVSDDGELSLKTPINVSVTTNSDDQITNVDFEYKDNYHKSFSVEWSVGDNPKITKFGHLPITWE